MSASRNAGRSRIETRFAELAAAGRKGLVTFITAGDPDGGTSQQILNALPVAGADFIELGMPFSDPMADGPAIQAASNRALRAGMTLEKTLQMVASFRVTDTKTPVILMGYYNPIYTYGTARFVKKANESGVDGLIVVDLPPEEDHELRGPLADTAVDLIRLVTPTTDAQRLTTVLENASGFIYYVSITGVTGTASANLDQMHPHLDQIRQKTRLPIALGFGIKSPGDVACMAPLGDAVVVGSAIVGTIAGIPQGTQTQEDVLAQVRGLAGALRG